MADPTRRTLVQTFIGASVVGMAPEMTQPAAAQTAGPPQPPKFDFEDVLRRARDLSTAAFEAVPPPLPPALDKLDYDTWRDIRFRPDKAFLGQNGSQFRLQLFHLGHLFRRPVTINTIRDGIPTPIPYAANLFDYGRTKLERPLPVNIGFAGFRLHYPLNVPTVLDEVVAFLGSSYFRFLGRFQRYGLSARGLAVEAGTNAEQFPFFREFWIETPAPASEHVTMFALLDGEATTGAYRFDLYAGVESVLDVSVTLFPRKAGAKFGLAPLTSMFFVGENDHRVSDHFRPELHDSDGLLLHTASGEWLWRPLHNPPSMEISSFSDRDIRGFGLLQRDRNFDHYQDLDLSYEARPNYWVEPKATWGDGRVELIELPTTDETNDNVVVSWVPKDAPEPGKPFAFGYKVTASLDLNRLSPNGRVVNTYHTTARALGSPEPVTPGTYRFIVDFAGGDLAYYITDQNLIEVVPTTSQGKIIRSFIIPNGHIKGFRAVFDLQLDQGQSTDLRAFLRTGTRALTETWTFPWRSE